MDHPTAVLRSQGIGTSSVHAGLLLPFGITKRIGENNRGWTCVAGLPLLPFRVTNSARADRELHYSFLPIRDELVKFGAGWAGRGLFLGRKFCRFRLSQTAHAPLRECVDEAHFDTRSD
jgi:hypothetical protein